MKLLKPAFFSRKDAKRFTQRLPGVLYVINNAFSLRTLRGFFFASLRETIGKGWRKSWVYLKHEIF